jgi:hypothetical protein
MKKEDITALIVYVFIVAIAVIFGLTVLQQRMGASGMSQIQYIGFILGAVVAGVVFNAILFELAHLLGAKIGRYDVLLLNILGFCFYKTKEGKTKFKFASFDGLTGETKIVPKQDVSKEPNPRPYLLFGTFFFIIELVAIVIVFTYITSAFPNDKGLCNIAYFFLVFLFIGGMIFLYNILPFKLDSTTDGYRLVLVSNPKNKVAFNELLRVEHEISLGNSDVEIKTFDVITNFTADLNLNKVYVMLDKGEYEAAIPLVEQIIHAKQDVSEKVYVRACSQLVFIYMMTKPLEEATEIINTSLPVQVKKAISQDISMVSSRAYILLAGLIDKSKSEILLTINNIQKAFKSTPKARRAIEVRLFNNALDKVIEAHPKWNLGEYHLKEVEEEKTEKKK